MKHNWRIIQGAQTGMKFYFDDNYPTAYPTLEFVICRECNGSGEVVMPILLVRDDCQSCNGLGLIKGGKD